MPTLHVMQAVNALLTGELNSYLSVKAKAQTIVITVKRCSKKVPETEKVWLRQGLNPQLSWLTTACLCGFDRAVPCLLSIPAFNRCKE